MRTVSIFRNRRNQAVRLPKEFEFPGATELAIEKRGDTVLLRPVRPSWTSFLELEPPPEAAGFLLERPEVVEDRRIFSDEGNE